MDSKDISKPWFSYIYALTETNYMPNLHSCAKTY